MNVVYLHSRDGGLSWSLPIPVSEIVPTDPQVPSEVRAALDSQGRLHVVWAENLPPAYIGRRVFYARKSPDGINWTRPIELSDWSSVDDWDTKANIAVDSRDRIHVVWVCGVQAGRCHRSSEDGGESWSGIERVFGKLIGISGKDAMASGPDGTVHWVGALRYPSAYYYSSFVDTGWQNPPQPFIDADSYPVLLRGHHPELAVGPDMQFHLVMNQADSGPVWYIGGYNPQAEIVLPPTISATVTGASEILSVRGTATVQQESPTANTRALPVAPSADSVSLHVLWSIAPVVLLVLVVILARGGRR
jgi:hypothetical protein